MNNLKFLAVAILAAALLIGAAGGVKSQIQSQQSILSQLIQGGQLNLGYVEESSYAFINPATGQLDGVGIRIGLYLAQQLGVQTVGFVLTDWGTAAPDAAAGKFHVGVNPLFIFPERDAVADFSIPFAYFDYAIGIVRKGETRFSTWQELNSPSIKVAVFRGESGDVWARANLPQAQIIAYPSFREAFGAVADLLADIALADKRTVVDLIRTDPRFDPRFLNNPPATTPGAMVMPEGDVAWRIFVNGVIATLCADGTLEQWAREFDAVEVRCPR